MLAIYKKEMRSYFINPIGYIYLGIFLVFSALLCSYTTIIAGTYNTSQYFFYLIVAFIILIPLLTMRLFAEERKMRTEQMLLTAPVTITGMVLGKYFAMLAVWGVACLGMGFTPIVIGMFGEVNFASAYGALLGFFLLGGALIAVCTFVSSLTENQFASVVITIAILLGLLLVGIFNRFIESYAIRTILSWLSIYSRFTAFTYGVFDVGAIIYYFSISGVFLFLAVRVFEARKYN